MDDEAILIGYVLDLLEPEERQAVESQLAKSGELRHQVERLRRWLLLISMPDDDPPDDLRPRTLELLFGELSDCGLVLQASLDSSSLLPSSARDAGMDPSQPLTSYPTVQENPSVSGSTHWRWGEILALAALFLVIIGLIPPAILQAKHNQQLLACRNNMRKFHAYLQGYAHQNGERLPALEEQGPCAHAGVFVLLLRDTGHWDNDISVVCPARGKVPINQYQDWPTLQTWRTWATAQDPECRRRYRDWCPRLSGCYAYHLGYRDGHGRLCGLTLRDDGCLPVLSDRPPREEEDPFWLVKNSPNHAGLGQNVLYLAGNVRFQRCRNCGHRGDDIFINRDRKLAAGCGPYDSVLAPSEATPCGKLAALPLAAK